MLILQRKVGESLVIGESVKVSVLSIDSGRVRLAIDAPTEIPILRSELVATASANTDSVVSESTSQAVLGELEGMFAPTGDQTNPPKPVHGHKPPLVKAKEVKKETEESSKEES